MGNKSKMRKEIKTADKIGKTTESWWALLFSEGSLGQSLFKWGWPVIGGALGGLVGRFTSWINEFGLAGWSVAAIFGALSFIAIGYGIETYRIQRLRRLKGGDPESIIDSDVIEEIVKAQLLEPPKPETLSDDKIGELINLAVSELRKHLEERINTVAQGSKDYTAGLKDGIFAELKPLSKKVNELVAYAEQSREAARHRFDAVDQGFGAIFHNQALEKLSSLIWVEYKILTDDLRREQSVENWGEWNHHQTEFRRVLKLWIDIAQHYRVGVETNVLQVSQEDLEKDWPGNEKLFPSGAALIAYRTVSVIFDQFLEEEKPVMSCLRLAAFARPSMKSRDPAPPIDATDWPR